MGRRFELRTDHCGLKYLFDLPTLNGRKSIWLECLCEFDFEIKHIKVKENKVYRKEETAFMLFKARCFNLTLRSSS